MPIATGEDITKLEDQYSVRLPKTYKKFLRGSHPNVERLLVGTDIDMESLVNMREWAEDLLKQDGEVFALEPNHFVFTMHQGYQFHYFPCDGTNDPPVFHYLEGDPEPTKDANSFSEWLAKLEEQAAAHRR